MTLSFRTYQDRNNRDNSVSAHVVTEDTPVATITGLRTASKGSVLVKLDRADTYDVVDKDSFTKGYALYRADGTEEVENSADGDPDAPVTPPPA